MTTQLMRPRTVLIIECRTCKQPWTYGEIDADGNGPCCHTTRLLDTTDQIHLELERIKAKLQFKDEQIRVLQAANRSLSPHMLELLQAVRVWSIAIDMKAPGAKPAAEQRLLAALAAVEETHA